MTTYSSKQMPYPLRKVEITVLSDNYKLIESAIDKLGKSTSLIHKVKFKHSEYDRERDFMNHTINSLRLEMTKFAEFEQELTNENTELLRRIAFFEEENKQMTSVNRRIESFKEDALAQIDEYKNKFVQKSKECEELQREKADLQTRVKNLSTNLNVLETITDSQREDIHKDKELMVDLEHATRQLVAYKETFAANKREIELLSLQVNKLESEKRTLKIDLENEQQFSTATRKELRELKDRLGELETQKREYINNIGVSKLGISTLNISKFFGGTEGAGASAGQPSAAGTTAIPKALEKMSGFGAKVGADLPKTSEANPYFDDDDFQSPPGKVDIQRESIVNSKQTDRELGASEAAELQKKAGNPAKAFGNNLSPMTPPGVTKVAAPPVVDFLGRHETPKFTFDEHDSDSKNNPYMDRPSSIRPIQSVLRVRDSRLSLVLNMVAGNKNNFDAKQDFMNVSASSKVLDELQRLGDTTLAPGKCYSDTIFVFNSQLKKTKVLIVVTPHSISFFNTKKTQLIKLYVLKSLKGVTISADNFTMSVLHFANQADLLLDSFRRLELISYVNQMFHENKYEKFTLTVRKRFVLKIDPKQQIPEKLEVSDPNLKINLTHQQDAIRNAKKSGYLSKPHKNWYGGTSSLEFFCLLTNLGIVYFKNYGVGVVCNTRTANLQGSNRSLEHTCHNPTGYRSS